MHSLQQIKRLNALAVVRKNYTFNNKQYNIECDFITEIIKCSKDNALVFKSSINDYTKFEGNLSDYIKSRVNPVSNRLEV
jgi:hypothetical protein